MLTKSQMQLADHIFDSMSKMLFANGFVPQCYVLVEGKEAIVLPLPDGVATSLAQELLHELAEIKGPELIIFVSEIWSVQRDLGVDKEQFKEQLTDENWKELALQHLGEGKSPSEQPDASEALMMLVLEVKTKETHTKQGTIKRDSTGGPYIEEAEWRDNDLSLVKTTIFPSKLYQ